MASALTGGALFGINAVWCGLLIASATASLFDNEGMPVMKSLCPECETMHKSTEPCPKADVMEQPYCCLACNHRFPWGECRTKPLEGRLPSPPYAPGVPALYCPKCGSSNLHPADGTTREVPEYAGPIGTVN